MKISVNLHFCQNTDTKKAQPSKRCWKNIRESLF